MKSCSHLPHTSIPSSAREKDEYLKVVYDGYARCPVLRSAPTRSAAAAPAALQRPSPSDRPQQHRLPQ